MWNWEKKKVEKNVVPIDLPQKLVIEDEGNKDDPAQPSSLSPTSSSSSLSSSSPSSTPRRVLSDIYKRCNFYVVDPENFEEAMKEQCWEEGHTKRMKHGSWLISQKLKKSLE